MAELVRSPHEGRRGRKPKKLKKGVVFGNANGTYALRGAANPATAYTQQITVSTALPFYLGMTADFELGNFDADPELEIIAIVDSSGYTLYYANRSGSSYVVTPMTSPGYYIGSYAVGIQIADFDGDGANDLVLNRDSVLALYLRRPTAGINPWLLTGFCCFLATGSAPR